jgi:hypothetical protein
MYTKKMVICLVAALTGATTAGLLSAPGAAHAAPCNSFVFSGPRQLIVTKGTPMGSPTLSFGGTGKEFNPSPATLSAAAFPPVKGLAVGKIDGRFVEVAFINTGTVDPKTGIPQNLEFEGAIADDGTANGNFMDSTWTLQPLLLCEDAAQAPAPAKQAKSQPGVTSDTVIGGLVIHVMNNSDDTTNCRYDSEVVDRDFTLQPRKNTDLTIVPALPLFRDWNYSVTCDNDTSTTGKIHF